MYPVLSLNIFLRDEGHNFFRFCMARLIRADLPNFETHRFIYKNPRSQNFQVEKISWQPLKLLMNFKNFQGVRVLKPNLIKNLAEGST